MAEKEKIVVEHRFDIMNVWMVGLAVMVFGSILIAECKR